MKYEDQQQLLDLTGVPASEFDGVVWTKSSFSNSQGNCVEVADLPFGVIALRDSKNPTGPALVFSPAEWDAFRAGVRKGEFDV